MRAIVIGAGVIGLSIARALSQNSKIEVFVIESCSAIGTGISSRSSEVIHSGKYYSPGSRKASLCVEGRTLLYNYLKSRGIPHKNCGKFVVATTPAELDPLFKIYATSQQNGVVGVEIVTKEDMKLLEPNVNCVGALWSPVTGILDSHDFMLQLQSDASASGCTFVLNCGVLSGRISKPNNINLSTSQGNVECDILVNAAGLEAVNVALKLENFPDDYIPHSFFCKGNYFRLKGT